MALGVGIEPTFILVNSQMLYTLLASLEKLNEWGAASKPTSQSFGQLEPQRLPPPKSPVGDRTLDGLSG